MTASLDATLSPLFIGQLKNLHKASLVGFKKEILDGLKGDSYDFAEVVQKARQTWEGKFAEHAKEAVIEDGEAWVWQDELELLKEEIKSVADQCRKDETKKMINLIEVTFLFGVVAKLITPFSATSRSRFRNQWNSLSAKHLQTCGIKCLVHSRTICQKQSPLISQRLKVRWLDSKSVAG